MGSENTGQLMPQGTPRLSRSENAAGASAVEAALSPAGLTRDSEIDVALPHVLGDVCRGQEKDGDWHVVHQRNIDSVGTVVLKTCRRQELEALLGDPALNEGWGWLCWKGRGASKK
jgi:hypothetical protein